MGKPKLYRCNECKPAIIFHGRSLYDLHVRTHKRLKLNSPPKPEPKPPTISPYAQGELW